MGSCDGHRSEVLLGTNCVAEAWHGAWQGEVTVSRELINMTRQAKVNEETEPPMNTNQT